MLTKSGAVPGLPRGRQGLSPGTSATSRARLLAAGGAAALVLWVLLVRAPSFNLAVGDTDEAFYLLVGGAWDHGHLPYAAIWDVKPPGLFALFAAIRLVFAPGFLAARAVTALAVFAAAWLLYRFARKHLPDAPDWLAPAAALLYAAYSTVFFGMDTSPELLLAPFVIAGLSIALTGPGQGPRAAMAVGLLFGCAVLIKQSAVFELALALYLISARQAWRDGCRHAAACVAAAALPSLCYLVYAVAAGMPFAVALTPFVAPLFRLNGDGISFGGGLMRFLPMLKPALPLLAAALLLWTERATVGRQSDSRAIRRIALWLGVSAAGIVAMRAMYEHYFLPLLPPLILLSLVALRVLADKAPRHRRAIVAGAFAVLTVYPLAWYLLVEAPAARPGRLATEAAEYLTGQGLAAGGSLYVVDSDPAIYLLTGAALPTRFPFPQHLTCDFHLPGVSADAEIRRIMADAPRFVVISHFRKWMVCERPERLAIVGAALNRSYRLATTIAADGEAIDIYRRSAP
jgi:4-amino-4-deoxy-L-arabinose transferase-like glycosyltransferase